EWHAACLKCAECNQYLDETCTCFVRDGKTYCKRDYIRYAIYISIAAPDQPRSGEKARERARMAPLLQQSEHWGKRERSDILGKKVKRCFLFLLTPLPPNSPLPPVSEPISARQPALRPHVHKQPEKTTRVRTVLNEKQLHTLRTCYAANPRPDALMKEQLVEMTGLSPRVIRVWFQNKRCKDKKRSIMMKQLQQQQPNDKTNIQGMTGTPMVAASPERHDGGLQANPVEVQSYQPPWKVLSDFALQSDIDQPAFQQLVNFSEGGPGSNSTGSEVASMSSQLPDTPNSMVASPIEA
ncbi:ISL1 protein, partial [Regulus satrapa]|nr:ISL1 protein [Regulus satrapa]